MGVKESYFNRVIKNIRDMVDIKNQKQFISYYWFANGSYARIFRSDNTIAKLGQELRPDYLIIKHCSDNEDGDLGVDYSGYEKIYGLLKQAESYSDENYKVKSKMVKN